MSDHSQALPWIWEVVPGYLESEGFRWIRKNVVMTDDSTGVTIRYRPRRKEDVICGARTLHPGYPNAKRGYTWRPDPRQPYEAACTILGDHAEVPHVGVPAECADMTCQCAMYGSYHLVITSLSIERPATVGQCLILGGHDGNPCSRCGSDRGQRTVTPPSRATS